MPTFKFRGEESGLKTRNFEKKKILRYFHIHNELENVTASTHLLIGWQKFVKKSELLKSDLETPALSFFCGGSQTVETNFRFFKFLHHLRFAEKTFCGFFPRLLASVMNTQHS